MKAIIFPKESYMIHKYIAAGVSSLQLTVFDQTAKRYDKH
jgi:hypothetical protein